MTGGRHGTTVAPASTSVALGWGGPSTRWYGGADEWPTRPGRMATERDVAGLPAFNRGKNLIGGLLAQMPLVDRKADGTPWESSPILEDPWPVMGRAEWVSYQTDALIMTGDAMAIPADYDPDGFPRQLVPIDPRAVTVYVADGQVRYDIHTDLGVLTIPRSGIWHAKGLTLTSDGLRGVGVIAQFALALGLGAELLRYGHTAFTGAGVPSGIVKVQLRNVPQKTAEEIKADWMSAFRDRVPAVLSQLMDFTPISWSPVDMALLEQRRFSVADIAFILNLDPMDLDTSLGGSMTYANRQDRAYDRLLTSIGPYLIRFEQAYRWMVPRGHYPTFDRSVVLWADAKTRAEVQALQLATGVMVLNEARAQEQRPLYGDWANVPFGAPPSPEPEAPPEGQPASEGEEAAPDDGGTSTTSAPPTAPVTTIAATNSPPRNPVTVAAHVRRPPARR
jgi:HK97 family phage portal protein